ncbi:ESX secretion-associated protein EspG [Amycolatopsis jiangsuensis]|nr:ESX secretion-associated protein EspG [Amycolatopsis jiangsuensis]
MTGQEIYQNFAEANGTAALVAVADLLGRVRGQYQQLAGDLRAAAARLDESWQGGGADAAQRGAGPLPPAYLQAMDGLQRMEQLLHEHAENFHRARNQVQPVPELPGFADAVLGGPVSGVSYLDRVVKAQETAANNVAAMRTWTEQATRGAAAMPDGYGTTTTGETSVQQKPALPRQGARHPATPRPAPAHDDVSPIDHRGGTRSPDNAAPATHGRDETTSRTAGTSLIPDPAQVTETASTPEGEVRTPDRLAPPGPDSPRRGPGIDMGLDAPRARTAGHSPVRTAGQRLPYPATRQYLPKPATRQRLPYPATRQHLPKPTIRQRFPHRAARTTRQHAPPHHPARRRTARRRGYASRRPVRAGDPSGSHGQVLRAGRHSAAVTRQVRGERAPASLSRTGRGSVRGEGGVVRERGETGATRHRRVMVWFARPAVFRDTELADLVTTLTGGELHPVLAPQPVWRDSQESRHAELAVRELVLRHGIPPFDADEPELADLTALLTRPPEARFGWFADTVRDVRLGVLVSGNRWFRVIAVRDEDEIFVRTFRETNLARVLADVLPAGAEAIGEPRPFRPGLFDAPPVMVAELYVESRAPDGHHLCSAPLRVCDTPEGRWLLTGSGAEATLAPADRTDVAAALEAARDRLG